MPDFLWDTHSVVAILHSAVCLLICHRHAVELQQEAKSHALNHVNIVKLYGMVFEPRHYGIVLEYVPCGDLDEYLFRNKVGYVHLCSRSRKHYRTRLSQIIADKYHINEAFPLVKCIQQYV